MSLPEPQYSEELSSEQRTKLCEFIDRFDQCYSDGSFDEGDQLTDVELLALGLRIAGILGFNEERLEQLFSREFGVAGMGEEGVLSEALELATLIDIERRVACAAGGRN